MSKQKLKLVCVGWGVVWLDPPVGLSYNSCSPTRREAIKAFNERHTNPDYNGYRIKGFAIAKKLWVEVKDE